MNAAVSRQTKICRNAYLSSISPLGSAYTFLTRHRTQSHIKHSICPNAISRTNSLCSNQEPEAPSTSLAACDWMHHRQQPPLPLQACNCVLRIQPQTPNENGPTVVISRLFAELQFRTGREPTDTWRLLRFLGNIFGV